MKFFLQPTEYKIHEKLCELMYRVEKHATNALELCEELLEQPECKEKITQQFLLCMKAQILKQQGNSKSEIANIYFKAIELTIPQFDFHKLSSYVLATDELFLILGYLEHDLRDEQWESHMRAFLQSVTERVMGSAEKAKILPKAVVIYSDWLLESSKNPDLYECDLMGYINKALSILQDSMRLYYMVELLEARHKLIMATGHKYYARLEENTGSLEACKYLYDKYSVKAKMDDDCYIYRGAEVYCIGDVIANRRLMLGLSRKATYNGICSAKTYGRIESKEVDAQQEIINLLLLRLGIPQGCLHSRFITNDARILISKDRYAKCRNNFDFRGSNEELERIKGYIDYGYVQNRQAIIRMVNLEHLRTGEITKEVFEKNLWRSLSFTGINRNNAFLPQGYLTIVERDTIYNLSVKMGYFPEYREYMQSFFREHMNNAELTPIELGMTWCASQMGDIGEYDQSSKVIEQMVKIMLSARRGAHVITNVFNQYWNMAKQRGDITNSEYGEMMMHLIYFSKLIGRESHANFLSEKYEIFSKGEKWIS